MGQEAACAVTFRGRRSEGKAYLGSDALTFRGTFRLAIPFNEVSAVDAGDGRLTVTVRGETATFELGARAARWAAAIRSPKSVIDKLGVTPDARVVLLGVRDAAFTRQVRERTTEVVAGRLRTGADLIFLQADSRQDLLRLPRLRQRIKPAGAVWVLSPRGRPEVREADVLAAGKRAGLVDVKVVRFSETHTAHKFVIPVAHRR